MSLRSVFKKVLSAFLFVIALVIGPLFHTEGSSMHRVAVGESVQVSVDHAGRPHVEPNLAIDPQNPSHLVATSVAFTRPDGGFTCAVFTSFDGGRSWRYVDVKPLNDLKLNFAIDPWITFGPDGIVFLSCIADTWKSALTLVFRSNDGGQTWSAPSVVPFGNGGSFDRASVAVDVTNGKFSGRVYVVASQITKTESNKKISQPAVAWSADGGRTFSFPVRVFANNLNSNVSNLVILLDGTVVVSFMDYMDSSYRMLNMRRIWVTISRDGGQTFSAPSFVAEFQVPDLQTDPHYSPCYMLAVDQSSVTSKNRLYMAWNDFRGDTANILISCSTDNGESWSKPVRVNDNSKNGAHHSTPTIAVNPNGVVGIAWYDRRADPENKCSEVYFSASIDGGVKFLPNIKVSRTKACPDVPDNTVRSAGRDSFGVAARWPAGGDYSGLAAGADGLFHALWSDSQTGVYQLWTTSIKIGAE
jgi:hypothetical protein